jgi:hypothetical protein
MIYALLGTIAGPLLYNGSGYVLISIFTVDCTDGTKLFSLFDFVWLGEKDIFFDLHHAKTLKDAAEQYITVSFYNSFAVTIEINVLQI